MSVMHPTTAAADDGVDNNFDDDDNEVRLCCVVLTCIGFCGCDVDLTCSGSVLC